MAITQTRAKRQLQPSYSAAGTLGPGQYELTQQHSTSTSSLKAFGSGVTREMHKSTDNIPGPGYYAIAARLKSKNGPSRQFSSSQPRFPPQKQLTANIDPGAYCQSIETFGKPTPNEAKRIKYSKKQHQGLIVPPMPEFGSIPSRPKYANQYAGSKGDTVGPTHYNPKIDQVKHAQKSLI